MASLLSEDETNLVQRWIIEAANFHMLPKEENWPLVAHLFRVMLDLECPLQGMADLASTRRISAFDTNSDHRAQPAFQPNSVVSRSPLRRKVLKYSLS